MPNFIEICPGITELFHANGQIDGRTDGRKDTKKLINAFRNFANAVKSQITEKATFLESGNFPAGWNQVATLQ